jgi:exodeoxyribonuclease V alpha subunit
MVTCGYHSQFSGFGISGGVVIPLSTQHYLMLRRNLIYTGITRGKRLVVLVGQGKALAIAVRNSRAERGWSKLNQWLRGEVVLEA